MEQKLDLHAMCAGISSGLRTFTSAAVTAEAGGSAWGGLLATLAAGEVLYDKMPFARARTNPGALLGRAIAGALTGRAIAKRRGACATIGAGLGAGLALAAAFAGYNARMALADAGYPDFPFAVAEDALAFGLARFANAR